MAVRTLRKRYREHGVLSCDAALRAGNPPFMHAGHMENEASIGRSSSNKQSEEHYEDDNEMSIDVDYVLNWDIEETLEGCMTSVHKRLSSLSQTDSYLPSEIQGWIVTSKKVCPLIIIECYM